MRRMPRLSTLRLLTAERRENAMQRPSDGRPAARARGLDPRSIHDAQTAIAVIRVTARYHRFSQTLNTIGVQKKIEEEPLPVFIRAAKQGFAV